MQLGLCQRGLGSPGGKQELLKGRSAARSAWEIAANCKACLGKKYVLIAWVVAVATKMVGLVLLELPPPVLPPPYVLCACLTLSPSCTQ